METKDDVLEKLLEPIVERLVSNAMNAYLAVNGLDEVVGKAMDSRQKQQSMHSHMNSLNSLNSLNNLNSLNSLDSLDSLGGGGLPNALANALGGSAKGTGGYATTQQGMTSTTATQPSIQEAWWKRLRKKK